MPTIGVIIVSYNTCELLRGCLESLRGCALLLRIVVVENASGDGSAAMVRACFPEAELVVLERNVGFAAGTNLGLHEVLSSKFKVQSSDDSHQGSEHPEHSKLKIQN